MPNGNGPNRRRTTNPQGDDRAAMTVDPVAPRARNFARTVALGFLRAALFVVFGLISLAACAIGVNIDGHADPGTQCTRSSELPTVGGPYYESSIVTGVRTFFPLGIVCMYDSPDDSVGPQAVWHAQWLSTAVWVAFGIASFGALAPMPKRFRSVRRTS